MKNIYFAPLEGITGYIYRNAYEKYYGGITKYFAPFIDAALKRSMKSRELRDVMPENNSGIFLVPQIMTNRGEAFVNTCRELGQMGYREVNLNLGCPSRTVVAKNRGAGMLRDKEFLLRFLDEVMGQVEIAVSIKTRLGVESPGEIEQLMEIYNRFSFKEIIIHPRVQMDYYQNTPNLEAFASALSASSTPVCYNGDICKLEDYHALQEQFPGVESYMIGRGFLYRPELIDELKEETKKKKDLKIFRQFHDEIYHGYQENMSGQIPVLCKMKELWGYWIHEFDGDKKAWKKLRKVQTFEVYEEAVCAILSLV